MVPSRPLRPSTQTNSAEGALAAKVSSSLFREPQREARATAARFFTPEEINQFACALEDFGARPRSFGIYQPGIEIRPPNEDQVRELRPASEAKINKTIRDVYDEADRLNLKPPNIKQVIPPVQERLRASGCNASGRRIQKIAEQHKHRRRPPGATLASERHRQQG
jgi:hypothetical protein